MAHPSRVRGSDPLEPPFPDEGDGPGGTMVERLESIASRDAPPLTDEHGIPIQLQSSELIPEPDPMLHTPSDLLTAVDDGLRPGSAASVAGSALARAVAPGPVRPTPSDNDMLSLLERPASEEDDQEGAELEAAPTRIERGEDVLGSAAEVPRLTIIGGNNRGQEFELKTGDSSIGRGVDNDVVLADIAVSRKHTLICYERAGFVVRDLGSGNGTLVNGERVDTHLLKDGDQLELGNTLLRFNGPPPPVGELASLATVITDRESVARPPPAAVARNVRFSSAEKTPTATERGKRPSSRTRRLAILGSVGVVIFLGMMVGVKAYLNAKRRQAVAQAAPKPDEIVAQEFQEGVAEFNQRSWEKARVHFQKVLALAPSQSSQLRQYVDQAGAEIVARDAVERARSRLTGLDYAGARQELAKVKSNSSYRSDAEAMSRKIDEREVVSLLREARRLESTGDMAGALEKVKAAQTLAPDRAEAKELYAALTSASSKTGKKAVKAERPPKTTVKSAPKASPKVASKAAPKAAPKGRLKTPTKDESTPVKVVPGAGAKTAMALYKKRQWGAAYQAIKDWAEAQKGKKQKAARALAESIRIVGQSWGRAEQVSQPAQVLRYYQDALTADAKIEKGPHQKELRELLLKAARTQAATALARRQNTEAFAAVKVGEKYGGRGDPGLQKAVAELMKRAQDLFDRAYTLRGTNEPQARKLFQEILHMVPSTSGIYKKTYDYLNRGKPNYQDEDED